MRWMGTNSGREIATNGFWYRDDAAGAMGPRQSTKPVMSVRVVADTTEETAE